MKCVSRAPFRSTADQRLRTKQTYIFSSLEFREKLLENCVPIVREARKTLFVRNRSGLRTKKFVFNEVLHNQIAELETDEKLRQNIYIELADEMLEWFAEQGQIEDRLLFEAAWREEDPLGIRVTCPICKRNRFSCTLSQDGVYNVYSCLCGVCFKFPADIELLANTIQSRIDYHDGYCDQALHFFLEPMDVSDELAALDIGGNLLSASCWKCDYYATV